MFPLPGVRARPGEVQRPGGQERRVLPVRRRGAQGPAMYRRPEVPALHRGWRSCGPQDGWPGVSPPARVPPSKGKKAAWKEKGSGASVPEAPPPAAKSGAGKRKEREESDVPASGASSPTLGNSLKRSGKKKGKGGSIPELPPPSGPQTSGRKAFLKPRKEAPPPKLDEGAGKVGDAARKEVLELAQSVAASYEGGSVPPEAGDTAVGPPPVDGEKIQPGQEPEEAGSKAT